jgi:hypothetical protein
MRKGFLFIALCCIVSCGTKEQENIVTGLDVIAPCNGKSKFIARTGFNASTTAFSTSIKNVLGLALIDVTDQTKYYQHPSWKDKGSFGPIAIDAEGNAYVAPIPFVNVLDAVRKNQHQLYKVNTTDGVLSAAFTLEDTSSKFNVENPFGFVGLYYDCEAKYLYASSLKGSTKAEVNGKIFCLDVSTTPFSIVDEISNTDAMGLGVAYFNNERKLFYGDARSSNVYSITIGEDGKFSGRPKFEFSLSGLGPRGDDVVKKIRFDAKNQGMQIIGTEFFYNLIAPTQMQESKYSAVFDVDAQKWVVDFRF